MGSREFHLEGDWLLQLDWMLSAMGMGQLTLNKRPFVTRLVRHVVHLFRWDSLHYFLLVMIYSFDFEVVALCRCSSVLNPCLSVPLSDQNDINDIKHD